MKRDILVDSKEQPNPRSAASTFYTVPFIVSKMPGKIPCR
jgi:hypothetical protein